MGVVGKSLTPTNWVGKLLGALAAIALIAVALMVSLMAFVLVGAVFAAALLAFLWQAQDRTQSPRSYDAEVERVEDHMEQR